MAKKKPQWRDTKPQNTSWEPRMGGPGNPIWEMYERDPSSPPPNLSGSPVPIVTGTAFSNPFIDDSLAWQGRETLGTAWGIGKTWVPEWEIKKRVAEMEERIAKEDTPTTNTTFDDLFEVQPTQRKLKVIKAKK